MSAIVASVIALSGCSSLRGEVVMVSDDGATYGVDELGAVRAADPSAAPTGSDAEVPTVQIGSDSSVPAAFQFMAQLVDGGTIDGASLYADAPLVMTFVQTTCPISDEERPNLAEAAQRHPDVTFVVVHSGGTHDDYVDMIEAAGLQGANVINIDDTDLALWNRFGVTASPSNALVDAEGLLRSSQGALGDDGLDRAVAAVQTGFRTT